MNVDAAARTSAQEIEVSGIIMIIMIIMMIIMMITRHLIYGRSKLLHSQHLPLKLVRILRVDIHLINIAVIIVIVMI